MVSNKGAGFAPGSKVIKEHFSIKCHVGFRDFLIFFFSNIKYKLLISLILRIGRGEIS